MKPWFVRESIEPDLRRPLFNVLGVRWIGTRVWWVAPLWMIPVGTIFALLVAPVPVTGDALLQLVGYGVLVPVSALLHNLGWPPQAACLEVRRLDHWPSGSPSERLTRVLHGLETDTDVAAVRTRRRQIEPHRSTP